MSDFAWYQFWVRHETPAVAVSVMKRCDPILQRFGAVPCAPNGTPIKEADGTIEVRAYSKGGFEMAKHYLQDQGFSVERVQVNE